MVKIKDFTLPSKNRGGGGTPPVPYKTPAHAAAGSRPHGALAAGRRLRKAALGRFIYNRGIPSDVRAECERTRPSQLDAFSL